MKKYFYLSVVALIIVAFSQSVMAQGCVAVKNMSSCSMNWGADQNYQGWQFAANYRYFRSYKHFKGREEQKERVEQGTEVINNDNSINLGISYTFNNRWSVTATVPYIFIDRSSMYEHLGNAETTNPNHERFHTQSKGFGDLRVLAYLNALPKHMTGNLIVGAGVKAPTGNYHVKDYFHKPDGLVLLPVDQSIQLGDGGWGFIAEVDFSEKIAGKVYGYVNAMYMINPRNTNGVLRSPNLSNNIPLSNEMSVPDQYLLRAGARYMNNKIQASLGARMECIPVEDLVGKSDGFRRPGYIISAEPSVFYTTGAHTFGVNVPVALERNRTQSVLDKKRTEITGEYQHGDAAFADWLVSFTYAYRLNKK